MERSEQVGPDRSAGGERARGIGLIDLLRVFWQWKILIVIITTGSALLGVVINTYRLDIYSFSMELEPAAVDVAADGKRVYVVSGKEMASVISGGKFSHELVKGLRVDVPQSSKLNLKVESRNIGTLQQFVRVEYETADKELGIKVLDKLIGLISQWSKRLVKLRVEEIDSKVNVLRGEIVEAKKTMADIDERMYLARERAKEEWEKKRLARIRAEKEDIMKRVSAKRKKIYDNDLKKRNIRAKIGWLSGQMVAVEKSIGGLQQQIGDADLLVQNIKSNIKAMRDLREKMLLKSGVENHSDSVILLSNAIHQDLEVLSGNRKKEELNEALIESLYKRGKLKYEMKILGFEVDKEGVVDGKLQAEIDGEMMKIRRLENKKEGRGNGLKKNREISDLRSKQEKLISVIKSKEEKINEFQSKREEAKVASVKVVQAPTRSLDPLDSRSGRNMLIFLIGGFFVSMFLAIFFEFVVRSDDRLGR